MDKPETTNGISGGDTVERDELFAEGMEAAHCDLLMKDCPYPKNSDRAKMWREGYREAVKARQRHHDQH